MREKGGIKRDGREEGKGEKGGWIGGEEEGGGKERPAFIMARQLYR